MKRCALQKLRVYLVIILYSYEAYKAGACVYVFSLLILSYNVSLEIVRKY